MKTIWIALFIGLFCQASLAFAGVMKLNLTIPEVRVDGLQGDSAVALKVEDGRKGIMIGRTRYGDDVVVDRDIIASSLTDGFGTAMRIAGFSLAPYRADAPLIMLVRVKSLFWIFANGIINDTVRLSGRFAVTVMRNGKVTAKRTIRIKDDHTVPWHPDKKKFEELVSVTLADGVRAVLQDKSVAAALKANSKSRRP